MPTSCEAAVPTKRIAMIGIIGYWLRKLKYPLAPLVVALVLGDATERELRKGLIGSNGDPTTFVTSTVGGLPLAALMLFLSVVLVMLPAIRSLRRRRGGDAGDALAH